MGSSSSSGGAGYGSSPIALRSRSRNPWGRLRDPAHLVAAFERLHAAVLAVLVAEPIEIPGRSRVILVSSHGELEEITGDRNVRGLFWISRLGEPTIVLSAEDVDDVPQVIAHELAHHVSYGLASPRRWSP